MASILPFDELNSFIERLKVEAMITQDELEQFIELFIYKEQ